MVEGTNEKRTLSRPILKCSVQDPSSCSSITTRVLARMCTKSQCQSGDPKDQKPMLVLVIYSGCYLFLLFQFLSLSLSFSLSFNLHMRCYLGPLNQVTSHSCLCPWEDRVVLTVRTHCSTGEE